MIKHLYYQFLDEIEGVDEYVKCSVKHSEDEPDMSKMYYDMASSELGHATKLYNAAKKIEAMHEGKSDLLEVMNEQLAKAKATLGAAEQ